MACFAVPSLLNPLDHEMTQNLHFQGKSTGSTAVIMIYEQAAGRRGSKIGAAQNANKFLKGDQSVKIPVLD